MGKLVPLDSLPDDLDDPRRPAPKTSNKTQQQRSTIQGPKRLGGVAGTLLQIGSGALEGAASLPGLPVELASFAKGIPLENSNLENWGAKGWQDFARRNIGEISAPEPTNEVERIARKGGQFVGGGAVAGPSGMVPSLTALLGSEAGRVTDRAGITGGYGEVVGGVVGGAVPGFTKGVTTSGVRKAPTIDEWRAKADAAYKAAEQDGVIVNQSAMQRLANNTKNTLANENYHPKQAPDVAAAWQTIKQSAGDNATLSHLDKVLRGIAGNAAKSVKSSEARLGSILVEQIDDFMEGLTPADLKFGNSAKAVAALKQARSAWSKMRKAELIDDAVDKARADAISSGTGGNLENRIKQRLKAIYFNKKLSRGFSKQEMVLMRKAIDGSGTERFLRWFGRSFSPSTGALQGLGSLGASGLASIMIHPGLALVPAAGMASKALAESLASRNASRLSAAVRGGSAAPATQAQRLKELAAELARRGQLTGQTMAPAIPGSINTRQKQ